MAQNDYYDQWGMQTGWGWGEQDPNQENQAQFAPEEPQSPGGGPQGAESQQANQPDEKSALDQALQQGGGGAANSPVNPDGSISQTYGAVQGGTSSGSAPGEEPLDEDERRQQRDENLSPYNPGIGTQYPGVPEDNNSIDPTTPLQPVREQTRPDVGFNPPATGGGNGGGGNVTTRTGGGYERREEVPMWGGFNLPQQMNNPYLAAILSQFKGPDQAQYENAQLAALKNALEHSEWGPDRIAAMKEAQKEQALRMRGDLQREVSDRFAGQGRAGAGAHESLLRRSNNDTMGQILNSYRGVDENAAVNRRGELLSTSNALGGALDSQMGRHTSAYGNTLMGQQAQAEEAYKNWQSQMQIQAAALQRAIAEESLRLDWFKARQGGRQFDDRLGYDWTALNLGLVR